MRGELVREVDDVWGNFENDSIHKNRLKEFFLVLYTILLTVSTAAAKSPEESTPQSPVWPKIVDKLIAKKKPNKIAVKFMNILNNMFWSLDILCESCIKKNYIKFKIS